MAEYAQVFDAMQKNSPICRRAFNAWKVKTGS